MDSSGSVGQENWIKIKKFTKDVISYLLNSRHDYQFAFVTFGSSAYINIHLDQYSSYGQFSDVIGSLSWEKGSSNIADGLRKARQELLVTRPNIPNLVVLVTDGPATAEQSNTEREAQMLRQMDDTHLLAIGLTTNVNTNVANQLQRMASSPTEKFVKIFDNFDGLNDVARLITKVAEELGKPPNTGEYPSIFLILILMYLTF
jgi:Mg-chelatase subunit ChlD